MSLHLCTFSIVGVSYAPGETRNLSAGDQLELTHEKLNQHDDKALRIDYGGMKYGYVPRPWNEALLALMDLGFTLSLTCVADGKNQISLDATLPEGLEFDPELPAA